MAQPIDWVERIFPPEVVASWGHNEELAMLRQIAACSTLPKGLPTIDCFHALVQREALNQYFAAAHEIGLLNGRGGKELRKRLASGDAGNYRGAIAECLTAWWLKVALGLSVIPRPPGIGNKVLDMGIQFAGGVLSVEVKAPFRPLRFQPGNVFMGPPHADHIGAVVTCLTEASKQFDPSSRNVVVLWPSLDWGIRRAVMDALIEQRNLAVDAVMVLDTMHDHINPTGKRSGRGVVRHRCYVVGNARRDPPPVGLWGGWPVYEGVNDEPYREPLPLSGDPKKEWVSSKGIRFSGFQITIQ